MSALSSPELLEDLENTGGSWAAAHERLYSSGGCVRHRHSRCCNERTAIEQFPFRSRSKLFPSDALTRTLFQQSPVCNVPSHESEWDEWDRRRGNDEHDEDYYLHTASGVVPNCFRYVIDSLRNSFDASHEVSLQCSRVVSVLSLSLSSI